MKNFLVVCMVYGGPPKLKFCATQTEAMDAARLFFETFRIKAFIYNCIDPYTPSIVYWS